MKLVLSRKGFDSENGGMPSPIMPDGTMLSLPIPSDDGDTTYHDIAYNGKTCYEIIRELNPHIADRLKDRKCHVDPDLTNPYRKEIQGWKPAFGQCGTSQLHLKKHNIGIGDILLFYGWFRQTEYDKSGKLHYIAAKRDNTPDRHVIYGYMEIGSVITAQDQISKEAPYHPHALDKYSANNALYLPKQSLSLDSSFKGWGTLKYAAVRQLTAKGHPRSDWSLPDCFRGVEITYHENDSYGWRKESDIFKAAYRGQEFVIKTDITDEMKQWLLTVIMQ